MTNNNKKKDTKKADFLYVVGGRKASNRVDVEVLFCFYLGKSVFNIDWILCDPFYSSSWRHKKWHGNNAYWVGLARKKGITGRIINKIYDFLSDIRTTILAFKNKYDVIQIRDKFLIAVICLIISKIKKNYFIFWLSYPFPEARVLDAKKRYSKHPIFSFVSGKISYFFLYKFILRYADHCFVQSEKMKKEVSLHNIPVRKMTAVPMGIDEKLLEFKSNLYFKNNLIYLGSLSRVRHLEILIEALSFLRLKYQRNCPKLTFVGEGDSYSDRIFLEKIAYTYKLSKYIEFTGQLPMEQALERVSRATICLSPIYPSYVLSVASPTKLIEYLALGKPVVANDHPEQAEIIQKSKAGICVKWSAKEFMKGIDWLLNNPIEAKKMGSRGRKYVEENRTYKKISDDLIRIYSKIII